MNPPPLSHVTLPQDDAANLRTLGICSYIHCGLQCLGALFALLYMCIGAYLVSRNESAGWFVVGVGALIGLVIAVVVTISYLNAKWLAQGKNWTFCMVVSAIHCASFPLGTALGVFTIIFLNRPSVKAWFASKKLSTALTET